MTTDKSPKFLYEFKETRVSGGRHLSPMVKCQVGSLRNDRCSRTSGSTYLRSQQRADVSIAAVRNAPLSDSDLLVGWTARDFP